MKKSRNVFLIQFILLITTSIGNAQDLIVFKNGDEIKAKVLEIKQTDVLYKNWTNIEGPTYTISKADIFMIKYSNGSKDVFNNTNNNIRVNNDTEVIKAASSYFKRNFVDRSNGVVSPVFEFKKTDGVQKDVFGQKVYEIEFEATISLLMDGVSPQVNPIESFVIYDKKPEFDLGIYERRPKGQSMILRGILTLEKTDNGYRGHDLDVRLIKVFNSIENIQKSTVKKEGYNSRKLQGYAEEKRLQTNHKGFYYDPTLKHEYWSNYTNSSTTPHRSIEKNLFYINKGMGFSNRPPNYGVRFGSKDFYENDKLIVSKHDTLFIILSINQNQTKRDSTINMLERIGRGKHCISIQVADGSGKEYHRDSWIKEVESKMIASTPINIFNQQIVITPEILCGFPSLNELYLSFLINDINEKNNIIEGFIIFQVEQ